MVHGKATAVTRKGSQQSHGKVTAAMSPGSTPQMPNSPSYRRRNSQRAGLLARSTFACYHVQTLDRDSACGSDGSESVADEDEGAEVLPSSRC